MISFMAGVAAGGPGRCLVPLVYSTASCVSIVPSSIFFGVFVFIRSDSPAGAAHVVCLVASSLLTVDPW